MSPTFFNLVLLVTQEKAFLPVSFGNEKSNHSVAARILVEYKHQSDLSAAAKHAVEQLLRRLPHLYFAGTAAEVAVCAGSSTTASDFALDKNLIETAMTIAPPDVVAGSIPDESIFSRPLIRRRTPRRKDIDLATLERKSPISFFPNALQAVQELSYASSKVRHMDSIDDILIANNIVHSANGEKTESYNYIWTWADNAAEAVIPENPSDTLGLTAPSTNDALTPMSLLDTLCGMQL